MAYSQTDIDNMRKAIATGVLRSRVDNRDTTFRSLAEMKAILKDMEDEVYPSPIRNKQTRFVTRKGLR